MPLATLILYNQGVTLRGKDTHYLSYFVYHDRKDDSFSLEYQAL